MTQGLYMKYFVLRPGKDDWHGRGSRKALLAYADDIITYNPVLAHEIREWVKSIQEELGADVGGIE